MKPSSISVKKSWAIRAFSVVGIVAAVATFQNCGPAFQTDAMGQIVMSSFSGPIEIQKDPPSLRRADLPASANAKATSATGTCSIGLNCATGIYLKN